MRVVCISDTHQQRPFHLIPEGDVLVHAGDIAGAVSSQRSVHEFGQWMRKQPHRYKILVAGNHDELFERNRKAAEEALGPGIIYLQDSGCEIDGIKFWGSPWQPWFHDWAFNLPRGPRIRAKWNLIPVDTKVLITHGPPYGILDQVLGEENHLGCEELLIRLAALQPRLHIFGHIHSAHGQLEINGTTYVNASICDEEYKPRYKAIVIDL